MIKIAFFDVDGTLLNMGHKDLSERMLEAVGTGVAMGNAKDEVKARAHMICKSVEEDGVYDYCVRHRLIVGR